MAATGGVTVARRRRHGVGAHSLSKSLGRFITTLAGVIPVLPAVRIDRVTLKSVHVFAEAVIRVASSNVAAVAATSPPVLIAVRCVFHAARHPGCLAPRNEGCKQYA